MERSIYRRLSASSSRKLAYRNQEVLRFEHQPPTDNVNDRKRPIQSDRIATVLSVQTGGRVLEHLGATEPLFAIEQQNTSQPDSFTMETRGVYQNFNTTPVPMRPLPR